MSDGEVYIEGRWFFRKICGVCGIEYYVPLDFERNQKKLGDKGGWHCPNGHVRLYRESEADRLRRERDKLKQEQAWYEDQIRAAHESREAAERRAAAARGQVTKLKNRASKGVCPCCNRHFTNLERHMASKHPGFMSEPDAAQHVN